MECNVSEHARRAGTALGESLPWVVRKEYNTMKKDDKKGRGRPRSEENDRAIMAAVRKMLAEDGVEGLRFDALAREAGVSRPSIYRRWATKADLFSAIAYHSEWDFPTDLADSDLRGAIRKILTYVADYYCKPEMRAAVLGVLASLPSTQRSPSAVAIAAEKETRAAVVRLVREAQAAGVMRAEVEPDALYDLMVGSIIYRSIFSYRGMSEGVPEDLVDIIMDGLAAG